MGPKIGMLLWEHVFHDKNEVGEAEFSRHYYELSDINPSQCSKMFPDVGPFQKLLEHPYISGRNLPGRLSVNFWEEFERRACRVCLVFRSGSGSFVLNNFIDSSFRKERVALTTSARIFLVWYRARFDLIDCFC